MILWGGGEGVCWSRCVFVYEESLDVVSFDCTAFYIWLEVDIPLKIGSTKTTSSERLFDYLVFLSSHKGFFNEQ